MKRPPKSYCRPGNQTLCISLITGVLLALVTMVMPVPANAQTPAPWPDSGSGNVNTGWAFYSRLGASIKDKAGSTDGSNGGTTPQQAVDIIGNSTNLPSVYYAYNAGLQVLYVRVRLATSPLTNSPDGNSNDDPWTNATWSLLIDTDGDGYKEFVVMLDGQSGGPAAPIDKLVVYYDNAPSQDLSTAYQAFSTTMVFPDRDGRAQVYDFGWGRAIDPALTGGGWFMDWQIPLSAFKNAAGTQLITPTTPMSFGYSTANSNTNPLQKDVVFDGDFVASINAPFPFGDNLTLQGGVTQSPIFIEQLTITGCGPATVSARVLDTLNIVNGTVASSVATVQFYYQKDSNGDGIPDAGASIMTIGTASGPSPGDIGLWTFVWSNASVANGTYDIWAFATDTSSPANTATSSRIIYQHTCGSTGASIAGKVYQDTNHNSQVDSGENGTGLTLYAKLLLVSAPSGPALQAVSVDAATGNYIFLGVASAAYTILLDDNNNLGDVTPTIPTGWLGTQAPNFRRDNIIVNNADITNQNFGLYHGSKITGSVFADTGTGGGTPNNGAQDGGENGLDKVTVQALDKNLVLYEATVTNASGYYTLWLPTSATTVKVRETNQVQYLSTGGSVGNTGGVYERGSDTTEFTNTPGTVYTNVNFADVPVNTFSPNNQQTVLPGRTVLYRHTFIAGSGGLVSFSGSQTVTPAINGWNYVIYHDVNGNRDIDAGEPVLSPATTISVTAGGTVSLIVQEFVPPGAPEHAQDQITITPSFVYVNAAPALTLPTASNKDITTVALRVGELRLIKTVDKTSALPGATLVYTVIYINVGTDVIRKVVFSDPISTNCDLLTGVFPGGRDILWQRPDGTVTYLTAAVDADEGSLENGILYIRMGSLQMAAGSSGMVQYMAKIR